MGTNVTPAVSADGTIFTVSRAHFNQNYGYVVALNPDLTLKWAASLRDRLNDGCGVLVPIAPTPAPARGSCRNGANPGLDKFHVHVRCFAAWEFERTKAPQ